MKGDALVWATNGFPSRPSIRSLLIYKRCWPLANDLILPVLRLSMLPILSYALRSCLKTPPVGRPTAVARLGLGLDPSARHMLCGKQSREAIRKEVMMYVSYFI